MAKVIMVQGTMSNVGKSLLTAGLCRIFRQDGFRVAPFKSQNMALNSYITEEGLEMGRAQVMQAEAAGVAPSVCMNPILLKPTNDVGSQVIVNGEVLGNMTAREYFAYKKQLIPEIQKAFDKLSAEYDMIVIEGAGSPAEINLKADDIVNMGMAKMAKAPVLLVGDIDRGGVFAQLIGTVMLLTEEERAMVKGLIINKFRGDKTILDPGIAMLEERAGIPVVGVAPYMQIRVEDEDSLTERFSENRKVGLIDIAVIRLPRISNFTDFNPFENIEGVSLRYVETPAQLRNPDMIILPGTKSTMDDLRHLRQCGLEAAVLKAAADGCVIFGICGGYQMMGELLSDPEGVEGGGTMRGMGLLPMETVFAGQKTRTRVNGRFLQAEGLMGQLSGQELSGYEIHMGVTRLREGCGALAEIRNYAEPSGGNQARAELSGAEQTCTEPSGGNRPCAGLSGAEQTCTKPSGGNRTCGKSSGAAQQDGAQRGNIYGTYVHGIFDRENVAKTVVKALGEAKGLDMSETSAVDFAAFKESQYDLLAAELRKHLDMEKIYAILEEGLE